MGEPVELKGDSALQCLVLLLRFHGIATDSEQLRHRFGGAEIGVAEILRCAKDFKLKARLVTADWARLHKLTLPAIAECRDGGFIIVARLTEDNALVQAGGRPQIVSRAEFESVSASRYILMTRRADLGALVRRFDISWFLQAMHKYRGLFV